MRFFNLTPKILDFMKQTMTDSWVVQRSTYKSSYLAVPPKNLRFVGILEEWEPWFPAFLPCFFGLLGYDPIPDNYILNPSPPAHGILSGALVVVALAVC